MNAALIIDITLWGSVAVLGFMVWQRGRVVATAAAREGTMDFINIVPRVALGVIGSGYIAAVLPQEVITGWFGADSGWLGIAMAAARNGNGSDTAARNQTKRAGMNGISHRISRWNANSAQAVT